MLSVVVIGALHRGQLWRSFSLWTMPTRALKPVGPRTEGSLNPFRKSASQPTFVPQSHFYLIDAPFARFKRGRARVHGVVTEDEIMIVPRG